MSIPILKRNESTQTFTTPAVLPDKALTAAMLKGIGYLQSTTDYSREQAVNKACLLAKELNANNSQFVAKIEALRKHLLSNPNQS